MKKKIQLSEKLQNPIEKLQKDTQSIPLTHTYMTVHFPGTSIKGGGVKLVLNTEHDDRYQ